MPPILLESCRLTPPAIPRALSDGLQAYLRRVCTAGDDLPYSSSPQSLSLPSGFVTTRGRNCDFSYHRRRRGVGIPVLAWGGRQRRLRRRDSPCMAPPLSRRPPASISGSLRFCRPLRLARSCLEQHFTSIFFICCVFERFC